MLADKLQFAPQALELSPARFIEQQPPQRFVFAAVQEDAPLGVSRDDRLKEDGRWEQRAKLRGLLGLFGRDARMHDLRRTRVAHFSFGDWLGQIAATACRSDEECLYRGCFRTGFVQAYIGAEEPRQREHLLQFRRQFRQVDDDLGAGSRDQRRLWHKSTLRMLAELQPRCLLDDRRQLWMVRKHQRWTVTTLQSQPVPDHEGVGLSWQGDHAEERLPRSTLYPLAGDHATQVLPSRKAVPDGEGRILLIVALEQLVLRGLDRPQDRCRIGGGLSPLFSNDVEYCRRHTGIRNVLGCTAQIRQSLSQIWGRDMRKLERDPIITARVRIGDAA